MALKNTAAKLIESRYHMKYRMALEGVIVGMAAGMIAIVYRLALSFSETQTPVIFEAAVQNGWIALLWFAALIAMALVVGRLIAFEPMISGSGIPQVEGELSGFFDPSWIRVLITKIVGGVLCILGGLSLGREGPSVQLGAMAGKGIARGLRRTNTEERYLITCGASAGLAAAFNAPLSGIMFALEEVHKNFSVAVLLSAMTASVTADFVSKSVFGMEPVFHFTVASMLPLKDYGCVVVLGVILGAFGAFYNKALVLFQDFYKKIKGLKTEWQPVIPFLAAGMLGFVCPEVLGGGHSMMALLEDGNLAVKSMLLLLVVKFLFSMLSFGSGAPGGIFFPLLVLGAYVGGIYGSVVIGWFGLPAELISNFIILAMAGYFTAIVRAPITGIVLIMEMTGSLTHLLSLTVIVVTAELTAALFGAEPVYDLLLNRLLKKKGWKAEEAPSGKTLITAVVKCGSYVEHKAVWEIDWPQKCLLVSIRRGDSEIIPRGDTVMARSDMLVVLTDEAVMPDTRRQLGLLCAEPAEKQNMRINE